jgi:tetratricopeptide (TPR) repeat protein
MKKLTVLMFIISLPLFYTGVLQADDKPNSGSVDETQQELQKQRKDVEHYKKAADILGDKEMKEFMIGLEKFLDVNAKCFDKNDKDELKAGLCMLDETNKLAAEGNVVAQHGMGNIFEEMQNYPKAIEWYQKALDNPKTPDMYKPEIQSDMDRAKNKQKK